MKKAKGFISRRKLQKEMRKMYEQYNRESGNSGLDEYTQGACNSIFKLGDKLNIDLYANRYDERS